MAKSRAVMAGLVLALLTMGFVPGPAAGTITLVFERTWDAGSAEALALGPDGSVYTAGLTAGERIYPDIPDFFDLDVGIVRWSSEGALLWQIRWRGGSGDEEAGAIAVDATGAAYVTGITSSFGTYFEAFLVKVDADGNLVWARTWGGPYEERGIGIEAAPDGSVYVVGVTQSFGSLFGAAAFLLKFNQDGALLWERIWQAPGGTVAEDIEISADGSIYVVGNTDLAPFLVKFSAAGDLVWDRSFDAPGLRGDYTDRFLGIGATPDGGVVAVGRWEPTFDGQVLIARFSADGSLVWVRDWGGEDEEDGADVAVAADGTAYVVGRTNTFAEGGYDIFVLKVLGDGRGTEARTWGGPNQDVGTDVGIGTNGDLYVVGSAMFPPFTFDSAPVRVSRVRGATVGDADAIVETPAGTVGTPAGEVNALNGTVGTGDRGGAVLLRIRPA